MRCEACGAEINELITEFYDAKGNIYQEKVPIKYCSFDAINFIYFEVGADWCGDGLDEEDIHDCILCPKCGKPPFINHEVQTDTIIRVIRFTSEGAGADA